MKAALFGGINVDVNWSHTELVCESMLRPNGNGIRLRFSGDVLGERLAIIIALPGLVEGEAAIELPSNVTVSVEGSGRFFSTPNLDSCWTDIDAQTRLPGSPEGYAITGTLYCVSPLGELNGDAAVSIPKLWFSGIVDWSKQ